ncbi:MAG: signal peptide peptidase SppA [Candidatus Nanoarchaeia archaeon]|nr:signal peptide peptidase SppA [Candidatus Nanoarchaeia archaeon]
MDYISLLFLGLIGYPMIKRKIDEYKKGDSQIIRVPFNGQIGNAGPKDYAPGPTTPQGLEKILKGLEENNRVKGIILDISSGGGEAGASKTIYDLVRKVKKPKVAYVNSLCASGAYMTACGCDEIIVAEDALIGSIGVIMNKFVVKELMEKIGVKLEVIKSKEEKDFMSMFRELRPEERQHLEYLVKRHHERFVNLVYESRQEKAGDRMTKSQLEGYANGYVWDGIDAAKMGLVDRTGTLRTAIKSCEKRGNFKNTYVGTLMVQNPSFFGRMFSHFGYSIGKGFADKIEETITTKNNIHYE